MSLEGTLQAMTSWLNDCNRKQQIKKSQFEKLVSNPLWTE